MIANSLIVTGQSRLLNKLYASSGIDVTGHSVIHGGLLLDSFYNTGTSGQIVLKAGTSGNAFLIRNDGNHTYFLLSSSNSSNDYNTLRPLYINNADGKVTFGNGLHSSGALTVASTSTFTGKTTHNGGMSVSGTASMSELTATKGVFYDAHITNLLRATKFDLQTIAQVSGGALYISPTIILPNTNTKIIVTKNSDNTVTLDIYDPSINNTTIAGATWGTNGRVKVSGNINGIVTGTCEGTITSINTTSYKLIIKVSGGNSASLVSGTYTASNLKDLSIALYNTGTNPVGILLNCYGTNSSAYIDIYGGSSTTPNVVIGNLTGRNLPAVNGTTPSGWSLYASNAFLSGTIVSSAGQIGGFTLSSNSIQSGTFGTSGSVMMCTGSNTAKSIANSAATVSGWCFTAGSKFGVTNQGVVYCSDIKATGGTIGRYTITSTYIYTGEGSNQVGIGGNQAFWAGGTASDSAPFRVSYAGALVTTNITATGGTIGGCSISNGKLTVPAANISGTLTASQIQVGLGGNLYPNYDTFTNITSSTISYLKNSTATVSLDTSVTYYGKKSLKIVSSGTDSYVYLGHSSNNYGCIPVIPNKIYRISCYVAATSASGSPTVQLYVVGHTAINSTNSQHTGTSITANTSWKRISMTYQASSTYPYISLRVDVDKASAEVYFDAFQVEEVSSTSQEASPFKPSGSTMIDGGSIYTGSINTNQLAANCVTAAKINVSDLFAQTISATGKITASNLTINGGSITLGSTFKVTSGGVITATSGTIGGMTLASNAIYSGTNSMSSTTAGIYLGTGGFRQYSSASSYVNIASGKITAKGADISGSITATSITASQNYSIYTGSTSTRFVYYTGTDLRIGLPTNKTGDLSDLGAGLYLYADGTTSVAGNLTANSATFSSMSTVSGGISCAGAMSVGSTFHIAATNAVDLSNSSAAFVLGTKNGQHIEMDDNRIQAKANATTGRALHLNPFGEYVHINYSDGEANGGRIALGTYSGAGYVASNSNMIIKATKFSASYPGSITLKSAGYWKSSSNYLNGTIQLQDANTNTWIHLAYDATKPYFASKAIYNRTTSSGSAVYIDSSGLLLRYSSASKYKTDIEPITDGSYAYNVLKINPKTWYDKSEIESYANALTKELEGEDPTEVYANYNHVSLERIHGLVAEDVEAAGLGKYCIYEVDAEKNTKELEGINYEKVTTLLIPIVRDLVLYTQKTAKYIHAEEITENDRGEIATLLSRINSFREEEVIA